MYFQSNIGSQEEVVGVDEKMTWDQEPQCSAVTTSFLSSTNHS